MDGDTYRARDAPHDGSRRHPEARGGGIETADLAVPFRGFPRRVGEGRGRRRISLLREAHDVLFRPRTEQGDEKRRARQGLEVRDRGGAGKNRPRYRRGTDRFRLRDNASYGAPCRRNLLLRARRARTNRWRLSLELAAATDVEGDAEICPAHREDDRE